MAYVPNAADDTQPVDTVYASTAAAEFRALKTRVNLVNTLTGGKEPVIAAGTASQYWRGDKSWQLISSLPISTATATALAAKAELGQTVISSKSLDYTLVLTDRGLCLLHPSADTTARTFTIPANSAVAFPPGTVIPIVNQNAAGILTIAITTDTLRLAGLGTTGSRTLAANGEATLRKLTSTEWLVSGTGLT